MAAPGDDEGQQAADMPCIASSGQTASICVLLRFIVNVCLIIERLFGSESFGYG